MGAPYGTLPLPSRPIRGARRTNTRPLELLASLGRRPEPVVPFQIGSRPAFLLNDPSAIEDVLITHAGRFGKGRGYERAAGLLGNSLLTASGSAHLDRRRQALPAFHRGRMPSYAPQMLRHAERLRDRWQHGTAIDVAREMREVTLGIAGEALFGADLREAVDSIADAVTSATSDLDGLLAVVAPPRRTIAARRRLDDVVDRMLAQRRASPGAGGDLLSILLESSAGEDAAAREQLRDDVLTFLLAGHDTLGHALTWTWILLSQHPAADEQLAAELSAVADGRGVRAEDLPRLAYTQGVLAEALRLFPPAWVIVREARVPHDCCGVEIPAGGLVVASPFVTHRDERFFAEPLQFDPGRWRPAADAGPASPTTGSPKFTYFPFGIGGRSCIGERFAWMEGTIVLATLARTWRLNRTSGAPVIMSPRITLRPRGPVVMTAERRRTTSP